MVKQSTIQRYSSPLRYPGGKGTLANFMKLVIIHNDLSDGNYVELFAGGAGIAWSLLFEEFVRKVYINDINQPLVAFWRSVVDETDPLCRLIMDTEVSMNEWYRQREIQDHPEKHSQLEVGFSTFFLNRTNRSGILRGGVIGGKGQSGKWKLDARYNKADLIRRIQRIARYANRISIHNVDAGEFIKRVLPDIPQKSLVYLDPPYFRKGQELYENHYRSEDHAKLADLVANIKQPWLVSYDNCTEIDELYSSYRNVRYQISYSAQDRYAGSEVIFLSNEISLPENVNPRDVKSSTLMKVLL